MAKNKDLKAPLRRFLKAASPRRSDYPRELLVGDAVYKIRFVRKIDEGGKVPEGSDLEVVGLCDPSEKEILILQGLDPLERFKALIHELLHAIEFEHDIEMAHALIYKLEEPIAQLLIENVWSEAHGEKYGLQRQRKSGSDEDSGL